MSKLGELSLRKKIYVLSLFILIFISMGFFVIELNKISNASINIKCGIFSQDFKIIDRKEIQEFKSNYCYVPRIKYEFNLSLYLKNGS